MKFITNEVHHLAWPFISGDVKKTLKSVGTTCDAGNYLLFTKWGGYVINERTYDHLEFERTGNTYGIGVWVRDDGETDEESSFGRQVVVRKSRIPIL